MIEVKYRNKEKGPIYVMFKRSAIKPTWIELIKIIEGETKKWGGIEMTGKECIISEVSFCWLKIKFIPWAENQI